jgi:hypothetical protein
MKYCPLALDFKHSGALGVVIGLRKDLTSKPNRTNIVILRDLFSNTRGPVVHWVRAHNTFARKCTSEKLASV